MAIEFAAITAVITAAKVGYDAYSRKVDELTTRRKDAAYEELKRKAHASCLMLQPDMALLEAVLLEADERGDRSGDVVRIRTSRDFMVPISPARGARRKDRPMKAGKASPKKKSGKAAPKKKASKPAPKKKASKPAPKKKAAKKGAPRKKSSKKRAAPKKRKAAKRKASKKARKAKKKM